MRLTSMFHGKLTRLGEQHKLVCSNYFISDNHHVVSLRLATLLETNMMKKTQQSGWSAYPGLTDSFRKATLVFEINMIPVFLRCIIFIDITVKVVYYSPGDTHAKQNRIK